MSRVAIAAMGTRGDVAPLTGVAARLRTAGHEVVVAAPAQFGPEITRCGAEFRPMGSLDTTIQDAVNLGPLRLLATALAPSAILDLGGMVLDALGDEPMDLLLLSPFAEFGGHALADARGLPSVGLRLQPLSATSAYPPSVLGSLSLGAAGNRLAGRLGTTLVDRVYRGAVTTLRERVGLGPQRGRRTGWHILHGYSPTVLPRPADWRTGLDVVGYWWPHGDADWRPSAELTAFLDAGPPPVFVGLGSLMTGERAVERVSTVVRTALRAAGVRGVVQSGWAGLDVSGEDILTIGDAPHDWLFPRMAAVVHACGAGTTAAGLRAGVPSVGLPFAGDQPFWAKRLRLLGVSPASVPYLRLNANRLATAMRAAVTDPAYRERARTLADRIAAEDGAGAVVRAVARLAGT